MHPPHPNNPLHGVKLETIVTALVETYGWEVLSQKIHINCFTTNPSIKSSLTFLRKTLRARTKVENLYLRSLEKGRIASSPPGEKPLSPAA